MAKLNKIVAATAIGIVLSVGAMKAKADDFLLPITVQVTDNLSAVVTGMDFGTVAVSGAGSIDLAADDSVTENGGISQYAGTPAAGNLDITGTANAVLDVTLPAAAVTLSAGGADTLTVDTFIDDSTAGQVTIGGGGTIELNVGATLNSAGGVANGAYTAAAGSGNPTIALIYN